VGADGASADVGCSPDPDPRKERARAVSARAGECIDGRFRLRGGRGVGGGEMGGNGERGASHALLSGLMRASAGEMGRRRDGGAV